MSFDTRTLVLIHLFPNILQQVNCMKIARIDYYKCHIKSTTITWLRAWRS
uniref:Uncharacterized protein n=1 Tax=Rhizophora mucronata TaxID=61149 RepID=A0A2P2NE93_RHIMU